MTFWKIQNHRNRKHIFLARTGAWRKGMNTKGHGENCNDENVLYLVCGVYICQNTSNCTSKKDVFYVCRLYRITGL